MYLHVLLFLSWLLLPQPTLGIKSINITPNYTANAAAVTKSTFFIAKPGCNLTCGNLTVPYPFGIGLGSGCSIDPWFDITCDTSSDPPKAFIGVRVVEVRSISQTEVRVRNDVARVCYDNNGNETTSNPAWFELGYPSLNPYTISDVVNKFTVVGCDDYARIWATDGNKTLYRECMPLCFNRSDVDGSRGHNARGMQMWVKKASIGKHSNKWLEGLEGPVSLPNTECIKSSGASKGNSNLNCCSPRLGRSCIVSLGPTKEQEAEIPNLNGNRPIQVAQKHEFIRTDGEMSPQQGVEPDRKLEKVSLATHSKSLRAKKILKLQGRFMFSNRLELFKAQRKVGSIRLKKFMFGV